MLVLLGPQNLGKSHFSRWLCPPSLDREHYIESPIDLGDKDSRIRLMTKLIWEVSELDATTRKADVAALKHFITQQQVIVRRSYARFDTQGPAMASMIGTVNSDGFLADETGNRRFYIVAISALDWAYQSIPIDQVWAEAVARYRRGEPWQLTTEEREHQTAQNRNYYQETPLHDYFKRHFALTRDPAHRMTAADIIDVLRAKDVPIGLSDHQIAIQLGRVAASLGIERVRDGSGRYYVGIVEKM
jgi:putative DNA primase/helicase